VKLEGHAAVKRGGGVQRAREGRQVHARRRHEHHETRACLAQALRRVDLCDAALVARLEERREHEAQHGLPRAAGGARVSGERRHILEDAVVGPEAL